MKINEFIVEAKQFKHTMSDYDDVPRDSDATGREITAIGPHEEKYLNLMLSGMKPAAILSRKEILGKFAPYIKSKKLIIAAKLPSRYGVSYMVTLPGEEWRGRQIIPCLNKIRSHPGLSPETKSAHIKLGKLLGYPNEAVRHFIQTRFR